MNASHLEKVDVKKAEKEQENAVIILCLCCVPCCFTAVPHKHFCFLGF